MVHSKNLGKQLAYKNGILVYDGPRTNDNQLGNIGVFKWPDNNAGGGMDARGFGIDWTTGEILVVSGTITEEIREKTEGYLAHKWKLQSNLANSHPYKNRSPYSPQTVQMEFFDGLVDDLRIYDRAIGMDEISKIYQGDLIETQHLGGQEPQVTLFWGDEDGGQSEEINASSTYSWDAKVDLGTMNLGEFSVSMDGLERGKDYYYRFLASNDAGSSWSSEVGKFTTGDFSYSASTWLDSTLLLWLDASDINADGDYTNEPFGGTVNDWRDKSGGDRHAGNGFGPSILYRELGDKSVLQFDGSEQFLRINDYPYSSSKSLNIEDQGTLVLVIEGSDMSPSTTIMSKGWPNDPSWVLRNDQSSLPSYGITGTSGQDVLTSPSGWKEQFQVFTFHKTPYLRSIRVNGTSIIRMLDEGFSSSAQNDDLIIGGLEQSGINEHGTFKIAEILIYDEALASDRIEKLEGYLAHKWSVEDSLTDIHPYKINPPAFENRPEILLSTPYFIGIDQDLNFTIETNRPASMFEEEGLPTGLSLSQADGVISGKPSARGTFHSILHATNDAGTYSQPIQFEVTDFSLWPFQLELNVSGYNADSVTEDFVLYVELNQSIEGFHYEQFADEEGRDILFLSADRSSELAYELIEWNPLGTSSFWVFLPKLENDTSIYVKWGNPAVTSRPDYTSDGTVWKNHRAVWRMDGDPEYRIEDHASGQHAIARNSNLENRKGVIGNAFFLDGIDDFLELPNTSYFAEGEKTLNISFWAQNQYELLDDYSLFHAHSGLGTHLQVQLPSAVGNLEFFTGSGNLDTNSFDYTSQSAINRWDYWVLQSDLDSGLSKIFFNGNLATEYFGITRPFGSSVDSFRIGSKRDGTEAWRGMIDEVRISDKIESTQKIAASYANQRPDGPNFLSPGYVSGPPIILSSQNLQAFVGKDFSSMIERFPIGEGNLTAVGLPAGLSINNVTGEISGRPVQDGQYQVTVIVQNDEGKVTKAFGMSIFDPTIFSKQMEFNCSNYSGTSTLEDFPLLIEMNGSVSGFNVRQFASGTGNDLRFFDPAGKEYPYEIETFDLAANRLVAWVKIPFLDANTSFSAYWGNPSLAEFPPAYSINGEVWSSGYRGVWHMRPTSGTPILTDSSSYRNHLVDNFGVSRANGLAGSARQLFGQPDHYLTAPINDSLENLALNKYSFSGWIWLDGTPEQRTNEAFYGLGYDTTPQPTYFDKPENFLALEPDGGRIIKKGPNNQGISFGNADDFKTLDLGITRSSGFMTALMTRFSPPVSAAYQFRIQIGDDDFASLWIDENRSGTFPDYTTCSSDITTSQPIALDEGESYNLLLAHGVPSGSVATNLSIEVKSDNEIFSDWTLIDPADPDQIKYYHLTFDGNLSDRISSVTIFQDGPTERLNLLGLKPQTTHRISGGEAIEAEGNSSLQPATWMHLFTQVNEGNDSLEIYLNGNLVAQKDLPENPFPTNPSAAPWRFGLATLPLALDEIRVSSNNRSPDWIKAMYDNQSGSSVFPSLGSIEGEESFLLPDLVFTTPAESYFELFVDATGEPLAFLASGLPGGITINPADGNLSGTPVQAGIYNISLEAYYLDQSIAEQQITLQVTAGLPVVTLDEVISDSTPTLTLHYDVTATGGDEPYLMAVADSEDKGTNLYDWEYRLDLGKQGFGPGTFQMKGLDADKRYFVRLMATNIAGTQWTGKETITNYIPIPDDLPSSLFLWFDANDLLAENKTELLINPVGTPVDTWKNKAINSTISRDLSIPDSSPDTNNPVIAHDGHKGISVVEFDGNDLLQNEPNSIPTSWRNSGYSALAVCRYTEGLNQRVITSTSTNSRNWDNWLMGFHAGSMGRYYFLGWVDQGFSKDYNFHLFEVVHEGQNKSSDPIAYIWNDAVAGNYYKGSPTASNNHWFTPLNISFGGWTRQNAQLEFSNCQIGEFLLFEGELEESERLLLEGYLAQKWGVSLPSSHPWDKGRPSFGEIVSEGVTPVGFTGPTSSPIAVNLGPANLRQSTASLTGQLINPGRGILKPGEFSPQDYPGLQLWLDSSAANGVNYDANDTPDPIPWHPGVVQEVVFHLDANDSESITLSDEDVAEWMDKSGNGYDMISQGHPTLVDYGYGTGLKVVRFETDQQSKADKKAGGDSLYTEKEWDTSTGDFTMFAVARYAADQTDEWYKNNFIISDRSAKRNWSFGFGYDVLGSTFLGRESWNVVSQLTYESHELFIPSTVSIDEVFRVTIGGVDCNFTALTTVKSDAIDGIALAIASEFPSTFNFGKSSDRLRLSSRATEISRSVSVSTNLTFTVSPPNGVFLSSGDDGFHLVAVDIDGSEDLANAWVDLRNVTQYSNAANTNFNNHFPKYLQFGGHGTNRGYSTAEIGEFIAFNKVLTIEERQKVEGYLFYRWIQMFSVDPSHPYASTQPDWSPNNEVSLQAWFDANDSSTINKNFVKKWKDSANQNEFSQGDLPSRPGIIANVINGLPVVDFDGAKDSLSINSRFGLGKNPDLSIFAVSITDSQRVSMYSEDNNISASPTNYEETKGPEFLVDQDLLTTYVQPDGNQSTLSIDLPVPGRVTAISFISSNSDDREGDPSSFLFEGLENNGSFSTITEELIPEFDSPKQNRLIAFENDQNFSTYRITFLNNQDEFNNSKQIELGEIDLLGVPGSDTWLSTAPLIHIGGQANTRILSAAPGSWRFNGGEVNYSPIEPNTPSLQVWSRNKASDYNSSRFFFNGTEQSATELSNPEQYPLDTNPFASLGTGYGVFGSNMPFDGKIGELIVLENASDETRLKFEGYLAHKWGLADKLPSDHPYKTQFNPTYLPPSPISGLYDLSGNGNHATQLNSDNQPGLSLNGLNGKSIVQFDGNDFLTFERSINSIRSVFIVSKRVSGNRGFLLGHSQNSAFQTGESTIWKFLKISTENIDDFDLSDLEGLSDPNLINGSFQENGQWKDGLAQDYLAGSSSIISITTDGPVRASNFSKNPIGNRFWKGNLSEILIFNEVLPTNAVREIEGYLAHKWGLEPNLLPTHPFRNDKPVPSEPSAEITLLWGNTDGGTNLDMWENSVSLGRIRKGLRKLEPDEILVKAIPEPNDKGASYPASKLIDGLVPKNGWRSTWTAWYGVDPQITFSFKRSWELSKARLYFQPFARDDELKLIQVYAADDELNFNLFSTIDELVGPVEQGKWVEFSLEGVDTQAIRLLPQFQGWGHQWGELEIWVIDDGKFQADIGGLSPNESYFYRTFASNDGGYSWAPQTDQFTAEDRVSYETGKLFINTTLGTWEHTNGDTRNGEVFQRTFYDELGNAYTFKVCYFAFDQLSLSGDLEIIVSGDASLSIQISGDGYLGSTFDLSGQSGDNSPIPGSSPGGFAGGAVNERGQGPGGGTSSSSPGGAGHGGTGSNPTQNSGRTYGDGKITSLLGGSGGGGFVVDTTGGGGGGALAVDANGSLTIDGSILALGGNGVAGSAGGSGGAIRLSADDLSLTENSLLDVTGGANGGAGGRIFLSGRVTLNNHGEDNLIANPGEGANLGSGGSVRFDRLIAQANLFSFSGTLTIDTNLGIMEHSDGTRHYGIIEDRTYRHDDGTSWPYSVCHFVFEEIQLGGSLVINLKGANGLILEARSGDFVLGADIRADGGHSSNVDGSGGIAILGGYDGAAAGQLLGNGPGKPTESSEQGHGAGHGSIGSGGANEIGHPSLNNLLGGSSGGSSSQDGSGAGGGSIQLKAAGKLKIEPNVIVSANGGNGIRSSASGAGGSIRLDGQSIENFGRIEAKAGQGVKLSGTSQTRGSSGGRIALYAQAEIHSGNVDVSGEWMSNPGSIFIGGNYFASSIDLDIGTLVFDTKSGCFFVEGGAHGEGLITSTSFTHGIEDPWLFDTCVFTFTYVDIGPEVEVVLRGDKPLVIQTVAGGDIVIGSDFILDGKNASSSDGYGGLGVLNPWSGRSSQALPGYGPGGADATSFDAGTGASFNYNRDGKFLVPGSSGSSGSSFQGSGAGGGAIKFIADGDFILDGGSLISASGGKGRSDQDPTKPGGGGSGGAVHIFGTNIDNRGMIRVLGGNGGAEGGQVLLAVSNSLEQGNISLGSGHLIKITPPQFDPIGTQYLKFGKAKEIQKHINATTRTNNLVVHWPMDEEEGFILIDAVGENHANLSGKTSRVDGKLGKAIEFDGSTAFIWTNPNFTEIGLTGKQSRSLSFWFWTHPVQLKTKPGLYGYGERTNYDNSDRFWGIHSITDNGFLSLTSEHYGSSVSFSHDQEIQNNWTHLAHLYDGSNISIYLNGKMIGSQSNSNINTGLTEPFLIGRTNSLSDSYFNGVIDDFRIYNDTLLPVEIDQIYRAEDIVEQQVYHQFPISISGQVDDVSMTGLPEGLSLDLKRLEVIGVPQESGVFEVNMTATNEAGTSISTVNLVVSKSLPVLSSISPRNISSNGALSSAQIHSDGGEALNMSLFWGSVNGGDNEQEWENQYTINDRNFSSGRVSQFIDGFEKNETIFYRWKGSNSVSSDIWSEPTSEGLISWWTFDEIIGDEIIDNHGNSPARMTGMNEGSEVFGYKGKALYFTSNSNESVQTPNFKGISGNNPRSISLWIHTNDQNATLLDFGGEGKGESWTLRVEDGKISMFFGGYITAKSDAFVSDSTWHHIVTGLPNGATQVGDVFVYLDGESVNLTPVFDVQNLSPEVWFDASDLDADSIIDTTPSGNISAWMDKSLNQREATSVGTPYLNTMSGPNNGRAIEIRSGDYLPIDGTFFAKDYFFVFRSPPANSVWSGYGGPMGHNPS